MACGQGSRARSSTATSSRFASGLPICLARLAPSTATLVCDDCNAFVGRIVDTRNYFTHYTDELKQTATLETNDLFRATHRLRILLTILLLKGLGIDEDTIEAAIRGNDQLNFIYPAPTRYDGDSTEGQKQGPTTPSIAGTSNAFPDALPVATACFRLRFARSVPDANAPFARLAHGPERPEAVAFGQKRLLDLGGIPQAVKAASGGRSRPPPNLPPLRLCRLVPSAPSALDCFPPFHVWAFVPPAAEKCACCFSSNRGGLSNFTDNESRQSPCATPNRGGAASMARFRQLLTLHGLVVSPEPQLSPLRWGVGFVRGRACFLGHSSHQTVGRSFMLCPTSAAGGTAE